MSHLTLTEPTAQLIQWQESKPQKISFILTIKIAMLKQSQNWKLYICI